MKKQYTSRHATSILYARAAQIFHAGHTVQQHIEKCENMRKHEASKIVKYYKKSGELRKLSPVQREKFLEAEVELNRLIATVDFLIKHRIELEVCLSQHYKTINDLPVGQYMVITDKEDVLDVIKEIIRPLPWEAGEECGGLCVRRENGQFVEVFAFDGAAPRLEKKLTKLL